MLCVISCWNKNSNYLRGMSAPSNINDTFFKGIYQDVWRQLVPEGLTAAEADFIESTGLLATSSSILDLMCGYGRHTLELAKRGYSLTAIDNLPEYIQEIKNQSNDLAIEVQLNSLINMDLSGVYDMAICMGNSFAFFNKEDALNILRKLSAHLKPGGCFVINTWMLGEIAIRHFKPTDWFYAGEYKYLVENNYLFNPTRIESAHTIITSTNQIETFKGVDYIFTLAEMEALFSESGFYLDGIYSTPRKKPFKLGDTRAYIVAKKA
jgi:SAM-dependent methyltransferase